MRSRRDTLAQGVHDDGVSVDYPESPMSGASNTEPLIRLNLEATHARGDEQKRDEVLRIHQGERPRIAVVSRPFDGSGPRLEALSKGGFSRTILAAEPVIVRPVLLESAKEGLSIVVCSCFPSS